MPQFVPHCPLKNEKGLRQPPFTINHYSLYNIPIGFYGNDSPAGVPRLPVHLKELQWKETELCNTQHSSCTALPALAGHCWDQPRGNCIPLSQVKQPFCSGSLHQWESPKFLWPSPEKALLEGSSQHLTGMVSHTIHHPRTASALNISMRGWVLLCSLGSHTPGRAGGRDGN